MNDLNIRVAASAALLLCLSGCMSVVPRDDARTESHFGGVRWFGVQVDVDTVGSALEIQATAGRGSTQIETTHIERSAAIETKSVVVEWFRPMVVNKEDGIIWLFNLAIFGVPTVVGDVVLATVTGPVALVNKAIGYGDPAPTERRFTTYSQAPLPKGSTLHLGWADLIGLKRTFQGKQPLTIDVGPLAWQSITTGRVPTAIGIRIETPSGTDMEPIHKGYELGIDSLLGLATAHFGGLTKDKRKAAWDELLRSAPRDRPDILAAIRKRAARRR
jgi:hypothetical protein